MSRSMIRVPITDGRGEYVAFAEDIARMVTIQVVLQILMALQGMTSIDMDFVVYLLQVMVGVAAYWLVVRRVVKLG